MTGNLIIEKITPVFALKNTAQVHGQAPGSNQLSEIQFRNSTDEVVGTISAFRKPDKGQGIVMYARNNENGSVVDNSVNLGVNADGTKTVSLSAVTAWKTALGIEAVKATYTTVTTGQINGETDANVTVNLPSSYSRIIAVIPWAYIPSSSWDTGLVFKSYSSGVFGVHTVGNTRQSYTIRYTVLYV